MQRRTVPSPPQANDEVGALVEGAAHLRGRLLGLRHLVPERVGVPAVGEQRGAARADRRRASSRRGRRPRPSRRRRDPAARRDLARAGAALAGGRALGGARGAAREQEHHHRADADEEAARDVERVVHAAVHPRRRDEDGEHDRHRPGGEAQRRGCRRRRRGGRRGPRRPRSTPRCGRTGSSRSPAGPRGAARTGAGAGATRRRDAVGRRLDRRARTRRTRRSASACENAQTIATSPTRIGSTGAPPTVDPTIETVSRNPLRSVTSWRIALVVGRAEAADVVEQHAGRRRSRRRATRPTSTANADSSAAKNTSAGWRSPSIAGEAVGGAAGARLQHAAPSGPLVRARRESERMRLPPSKGGYSTHGLGHPSTRALSLPLLALVFASTVAGVAVALLARRWPRADPHAPEPVEPPRAAPRSGARRPAWRCRSRSCCSSSAGSSLARSRSSSAAIPTRSGSTRARRDGAPSTRRRSRRTVLQRITNIGQPRSIIVLAAALGIVETIRTRSRWIIPFLLVVVAGNGFITTTIKHLADRVRPSFNPAAEALGPSFPSGHSSWSAAFFAAAALRPRARTRVAARGSCSRASPPGVAVADRGDAGAARRALAERRGRGPRARVGVVRGVRDRVRRPAPAVRRDGRGAGAGARAGAGRTPARGRRAERRSRLRMGAARCARGASATCSRCGAAGGRGTRAAAPRRRRRTAGRRRGARTRPRPPRGRAGRRRCRRAGGRRGRRAGSRAPGPRAAAARSPGRAYAVWPENHCAAPACSHAQRTYRAKRTGPNGGGRRWLLTPTTSWAYSAAGARRFISREPATFDAWAMQDPRREDVDRARAEPADEVAPRGGGDHPPQHREVRLGRGERGIRAVDDDLDLAGDRRERVGQALARAFEQLQHAGDVVVVDELVSRGEVRRRRLDPGHPRIFAPSPRGPCRASSVRRGPACDRRRRPRRSPRSPPTRGRTPRRRARACPRTEDRA